MRLLRIVMMAISAAAKKPLAKISNMMMIISSQKLCRIIGVVSYFSSPDRTGRNDGSGVTVAKLMVYEQAGPAPQELNI